MARPTPSQPSRDLWHLSIDDLLAPASGRSRLGGPGPFVINLSASTAPISLPTKPVGNCRDAIVYQIQRYEDGRVRYRLRLGPFSDEDAMDPILDQVRLTYPSALTATAGADDLYAIESLRAKAGARQRPAPPRVAARKPAPVPQVAAQPAPQLAAPPAPQPAAKRPKGPVPLDPEALQDLVDTITIVAEQLAPSQKAPSKAAPVAPTVAAAETPTESPPPELVEPPAVAAAASAQEPPTATVSSTASVAQPPTSVPVSPPQAPIDNIPTLEEVVPVPTPARKPQVPAEAPVAVMATPAAEIATPVVVAKPQIAPETQVALETEALAAPETSVVAREIAATPEPAAIELELVAESATAGAGAALPAAADIGPLSAVQEVRGVEEIEFELIEPMHAPLAAAAMDPNPAAPASASTEPQFTLVEPPAPLEPPQAARPPAAVEPAATLKVAAAAEVPAAFEVPVAQARPVVAEATSSKKPPPAGAKRPVLVNFMRQAFARATMAQPANPAPARKSQAAAAKTPAAAQPAGTTAVRPAPTIVPNGKAAVPSQPVSSIETTRTVRALTQQELADQQTLRWFAIQLATADSAFDPENVPYLDIFSVYRLYSVAGFDQGREVHSLRLGFFADEGSARMVAGYVAAYYENPTVKRVSVAERKRFEEQGVEARKDVGATGKHAVIEITDELVIRENRLRG